tara:strand:- start:424 stop:660 length:237 start_codon:yes stop_codon:yes gene_type:complete
MAFDENLNKELFSETKKFETSRIKVGVYSYNDGEKKLQISRENLNQENAQWKFAKLGRMFKDEVEAVIPIMKKCLEHM